MLTIFTLQTAAVLRKVKTIDALGFPIAQWENTRSSLKLSESRELRAVGVPSGTFHGYDDISFVTRLSGRLGLFLGVGSYSFSSLPTVRRAPPGGKSSNKTTNSARMKFVLEYWLPVENKCWLLVKCIASHSLCRGQDPLKSEVNKNRCNLSCTNSHFFPFSFLSFHKRGLQLSECQKINQA